MKLKFVGVLAFLFAFMPGQVLAQGLFEAFSFPQSVTATGHTEVAGSLIVSLRSGTTAAGTLVIDVSPRRITNASAADIRVTPAGNIAVSATTIDVDTSIIRIPVLAGGTSGSIRVDGIRLSVAGTNVTSVSARLSWEGSLNVLSSGATLTLINGVQSGLAADVVTDRFVIFNGQIVDNTETIKVREGFASAFSNATAYGQTVPTRVRVKVTDFPENLVMTFPATVSDSTTGATLTTTGGTAVVLRRNGEVLYNFAGATGSSEAVESFSIPFVVTLDAAPGITQPTIEVSLAPVGAAVPDSTFPSTDIPRYAEDNIVVQEGTSRIITKVLYWTGINESQQNQVTILNPSSRAANLTITGSNASGATVTGTGITNPVKLSVSANQSLVRTVAELFGASTGITSIRIQSTGADLLATATVTAAGAGESVPFLSNTIAEGFVPVVNEGAQVHLMNTGSSTALAVLTLRDTEGRLISTSSLNLASMASASLSLSSVFTNPSAGYVYFTSTSPVVAFESFGENGTLNIVPIEPANGVAALYEPFFAVGNGFQTDLNLINVSEDTVVLRGQIYDGDGAAFGSAVLITMPAKEQLAIAVDRLFARVPATGYIRFDVPQVQKGFFFYYPTINGHARLKSSNGGSTVIALSEYPLQDAFIPASGTGSSEFQGISLVNPTAAAVTVSLQALSTSGTSLGSTTLTLNPGQLVSRLTTDFFSTVIPAGSAIRVTASAPIVTSTIVGSNAMDVLRALPVTR
jgi:hypothetical protein